MAVALMEAISLWNFGVATPPCCQVHSAARMAQRLCDELLAKPCFPDMDPGFQCMKCGMLGYDKQVDVCEVCTSLPSGNRPYRPALPTKPTSL
mmetsp:Transcript_153840/g.472956  ORF Transcript_153840/g.472956 Transcript_153840/m.472956 type:complete len:93 (+) Transcript_153840:133-411(+)